MQRDRRRACEWDGGGGAQLAKERLRSWRDPDLLDREGRVDSTVAVSFYRLISDQAPRSKSPRDPTNPDLGSTRRRWEQLLLHMRNALEHWSGEQKKVTYGDTSITHRRYIGEQAPSAPTHPGANRSRYLSLPIPLTQWSPPPRISAPRRPSAPPPPARTRPGKVSFRSRNRSSRTGPRARTSGRPASRSRLSRAAGSSPAAVNCPGTRLTSS